MQNTINDYLLTVVFLSICKQRRNTFDISSFQFLDVMQSKLGHRMLQVHINKEKAHRLVYEN